MPKIRNRTECAPVSTPSIVLLWHPRWRRVAGCFVGSDSFVVTVSFGIPRQTPAFDESLRHHFVLEQSLRNILNRYRSIGQPQYPAVACIATLSRLGVIIPSQVFVSLSVLFDRNLFVMKYNPHFFCNFLQKKCRFHPVLWQGDTKRCCRTNDFC